MAQLESPQELQPPQLQPAHMVILARVMEKSRDWLQSCTRVLVHLAKEINVSLRTKRLKTSMLKWALTERLQPFAINQIQDAKTWQCSGRT
eukprot:449536-Amphidinium_carterae.1